jgi:hypothetical protein
VSNRALAALLLLSCLATSARAQAPLADDAAAARDAEVQARLRFLERSLDGEVATAEAWTWGWVTFNTAAASYEIYNAAHSRGPDRVDAIVAVGKAGIGIAGRLIRPLYARRGAGELVALPSATPAEREAKLRVAERLLARNAREADLCHQWLPHLMSVALNVAGAIVTWAVADAPALAWRQAGIGVVVGEIVIWTQPRQALRDLAEYRRRFAGERASAPPPSRSTAPSLSLAPLGGGSARASSIGAALSVRF